MNAQVLSWGNASELQAVMNSLPTANEIPLLVLAADCVYWECLFDPFLQTLLQITSAYGITVHIIIFVIICILINLFHYTISIAFIAIIVILFSFSQSIFITIITIIIIIIDTN